MISRIESNGSSLTYNTQSSSQQVSSLMPLAHLAHPPTHHPSSNPVCSPYLRVSYVLSPCFYVVFAPLPLCSSVLYLKFHISVKSYDICLSLISLSIILLTNIPSVYICHIFFIHSSVDGHLGSFHTLAIVNKIVINFGVHMPLQNSTPVSLG